MMILVLDEACWSIDSAPEVYEQYFQTGTLAVASATACIRFLGLGARALDLSGQS